MLTTQIKFCSIACCHFKTACLLVVVGLSVVVPGCYQRPMAPEATYSQAEVDVLKEEMKKFEWE